MIGGDTDGGAQQGDPLLIGPGGVDSPRGQRDRFGDEPTLSQLEARYIAYLLERHGGNRSACARILEIGRNTLLRKIREYGLEQTGDQS